MKTCPFLVKLLILTIISYIIFSCDRVSKKLDPYLIKVDSIHLSGIISSNVPFEIEFFGTIAGDGCHTFDSFTQSLINKDINIEAWGNYTDYNGACPAVLVYLTGHNLTLTLPSSGIYNIKIRQPDNSFLTKQITVN
jgi:hypothetical protein